MFTSPTSTRDFALKAASAAQRAMDRQACCKSQFKFKCFSCGKMINRGDKITRVISDPTGMTLRYRGAGGECGLTMAETSFYQGETGTRSWVHIGCIPCYWDSLPPTTNPRIPSPKLRPICTDWGVKVYGEWEDWVGDDEKWELMGLPYFRMVKGYPKEKFMRDRIIHAVTRFQALWRGYIYKKAYPIALQQQREQRARARAQYQEMLRTSPQVGDHVEVLFNKDQPSETIYSGEIIEIQYRGTWVKIKVKYHYDDEVRKYTMKKYNILKKECDEHKRMLGIEAKLTGKLPTGTLYRKPKQRKMTIN